MTTRRMWPNSALVPRVAPDARWSWHPRHRRHARLHYDSFGRQLALRYPDGELVTNTYDAAGALRGVRGTAPYADNIRYDVFGNRTRMEVGKVVTTWSFDPVRVRLANTSSTLQIAGAPKIQNLTYGYDPAGNPISIANNLPPSTGKMPGSSTSTFTYDGVDRLTHIAGQAALDATTSTAYQQTFTYSPSHNVSTKSRIHTVGATTPPATNFNFNFNFNFTFTFTCTYSTRPHLPDAVGSLLLQYDASGNPTQRNNAGQLQELVWDDDDRMVDYTDQSSGVTQHNAYDADGLRVLRVSDGPNGEHTTIFTSPFHGIEDGAELKHIFAGDMRVATYVDDALYFLHSNHLGSIGVVTDGSGTVHQSVEYFADGETWIDRAHATPVNGYLFNGKPFDPETGFYDYGQRFYDPRTSLWLGVDPAFLDATDLAIGRPGMSAVLGYAAHSASRYTDPDGRDVSDTVRAVGRGVANVANVARKTYHGVKHAVTNPIQTVKAIGYRVSFPLFAAIDDAESFGTWAGATTVAVQNALSLGDTNKVIEIGCGSSGAAET